MELQKPIATASHSPFSVVVPGHLSRPSGTGVAILDDARDQDARQVRTEFPRTVCVGGNPVGDCNSPEPIRGKLIGDSGGDGLGGIPSFDWASYLSEQEEEGSISIPTSG